MVDYLGELLLLLVGKLRSDCLVESLQLLHRRERLVKGRRDGLLLVGGQVELLGDYLEMSLWVIGLAMLDLGDEAPRRHEPGGDHQDGA